MGLRIPLHRQQPFRARSRPETCENPWTQHLGHGIHEHTAKTSSLSSLELTSYRKMSQDFVVQLYLAGINALC